ASARADARRGAFVVRVVLVGLRGDGSSRTIELRGCECVHGCAGGGATASGFGGSVAVLGAMGVAGEGDGLGSESCGSGADASRWNGGTVVGGGAPASGRGACAS